MSKLHICLSTDQRWLRFAQRAVYDIIVKRNADTEIKFYILGDKVDSETLAEAFGIPKSAVVIKSGESSKNKRLLLRGVSAAEVRKVVAS